MDRKTERELQQMMENHIQIENRMFENTFPRGDKTEQVLKEAQEALAKRLMEAHEATRGRGITEADEAEFKMPEGRKFEYTIDSTGVRRAIHKLDCPCDYCVHQRAVNKSWREAGW